MLKFWENKDLALLRRSKEFNKKENRSFTRANDKFGSSYGFNGLDTNIIFRDQRV